MQTDERYRLVASNTYIWVQNNNTIYSFYPLMTSYALWTVFVGGTNHQQQLCRMCFSNIYRPTLVIIFDCFQFLAYTNSPYQQWENESQQCYLYFVLPFAKPHLVLPSLLSHILFDREIPLWFNILLPYFTPKWHREKPLLYINLATSSLLHLIISSPF